MEKFTSLWRRWTETYFRPNVERAVGVVIGIFYPRCLPRMAMLEFCVSDNVHTGGAQASFVLMCLDTRESVTLTLHGDQVTRFYSFVLRAHGKLDGTSN